MSEAATSQGSERSADVDESSFSWQELRSNSNHASLVRSWHTEAVLAAFGRMPAQDTREVFNQRIDSLPVSDVLIYHRCGASPSSQPVAYVNASSAAQEPGLGHLGLMYVVPSWRGTLVSGMVMNRAVAYFRQAGFPAAELAVAASNHRGIACYRKFGWYDNGAYEAPFPVPAPLRRMCLDLGASAQQVKQRDEAC